MSDVFHFIVQSLKTQYLKYFVWNPFSKLQTTSLWRQRYDAMVFCRVTDPEPVWIIGSGLGLDIWIRIQSEHSDLDMAQTPGSNIRTNIQSKHPDLIWKPGSGSRPNTWIRVGLNTRIRIHSTHPDSKSYKICSHRNFAWYLLEKSKN